MALFYMNKAIELKDEEDARVLRAEIYKSNDDINHALNEYKYLVSKKPDNIEYVINLANIYISKRNYIKARRVLKNYREFLQKPSLILKKIKPNEKSSTAKTPIYDTFLRAEISLIKIK